MVMDWANGIVNESGWNGTGYKYAVEINCKDFSMDTDDWTITVKKGNKTLVFTPENSVHHVENEGQENEVSEWYICVESSLLGPGTLEVVYDACVPDADFPDGIRHEIIKQNLIINQKL